MFQIFNKARGSVELTVSGAEPETFLNCCNSMGIELQSVQSLDRLTLLVRGPASELERLRSAAARSMCELSLLEVGGAEALRRIVTRRVIPAVMIMLFISLALFSRLFIWEMSVEGNETVPTGDILDVLEQCGVGYGSFWPAFTSDNIRSEVLVKMPELSWMTVNIHGSKAQVIVRERIPKPELFDPLEPMSITAKKTGFITNVSTLAGTALVKRGQAVTEGDELISGLVRSSFSSPRLIHARGSVMAQTYYELTAAMPREAAVKRENGEKSSCWALVIGKNRYNFYSNGSIVDGDCDKIISVWEMKAAGLFSFPVKIVRETRVGYELVREERDGRETSQIMKETLRAVLDGNICGGEILREHFSSAENGDNIFVCLRAVCHEDIGKSVSVSESEKQEYLSAKGRQYDRENN